MTITECAALLAAANQIDPRIEITEQTVEMWHHLIGDLPAHACAQAITTHYRRNTTRVMPADIRAIARTNPTAPTLGTGLVRMPPGWSAHARKEIRR